MGFLENNVTYTALHVAGSGDIIIFAVTTTHGKTSYDIGIVELYLEWMCCT